MMLRVIDTGVFLPTLITVLILSIAIAIFCREHTFRRIILVWILACLFLMLYSTVLGRTPCEDVSFQLTPFWSVGAIQRGLVEVLYEKIYNVLFFVPYGFLLGLYLGCKKLTKTIKTSTNVCEANASSPDVSESTCESFLW